jgi:hypothetical protein
VFEGIPWGPATVFDIFSYLCELNPTAEYKETDAHWFLGDTYAWEEKPTESWLGKLTAVTASTLVDIINLRVRFASDVMTDSHINEILRSHPTPHWAGDKIPEFCITDDPLQSFADAMSSKGNSTAYKTVSKNTGPVSSSFREMVEQIHTDRPDMEASHIQQLLERAKKSSAENEESLLNALTALDSEWDDNASVEDYISNGIRSVQEPSRNRSRPGQVIFDSISVPAMSEPARIES